MFIRNLKTGGALVLLGMIGVALAAAPSGEPKSDKEAIKDASPPAQPVASMPSFEALDADADGVLIKSETRNDLALASRYGTYDLDHSETLSRKEYERYSVNAADDLFADDTETP